LLLASSVGALALLGGHTAFAADAAADASATRNSSSTVEELVVTVQKRSENIQNVPASVSAITGSKLESLNVKSLSDYASYVPGLNVETAGSPGQTLVTLRGIAPVGPGATVGTYIDDTPLGSSTAYARGAEFELDLMPYDIDRLEVLRGPQGTLYGASAMGGILKYVLKEPSLTTFSGRVGADLSGTDSAGNPGWGLRGNVNLPIVSDKVGLTVSAYDSETPGWIDNVGTGVKDSNKVKQYGGRIAALLKPTDDITVKLNAMWQKIDSADNSSVTRRPLIATTNPDDSAFYTGLRSFGLYGQRTFVPQPFIKDVKYYSASVDWDLHWATLISATSYSHTTTNQVQDSTNVYGAAFPLFTGGAVDPGIAQFAINLGLDKFTQEFRLQSPSGQKLEWLAGAFYTHENSTNHQVVTGTTFAGGDIPIFDPNLADIHLPTNYEEIAGFGDLTLHVTDQFEITAGGRYSHNKQQFQELATGVIVPTADILGGSSESVFTWMASAKFHFTPDQMLYARVATGYRPGGPNPLLPGAQPTFGSDKLTNYEIGLKSEFLDHRAMFNLSGFYIDWSNIQLSLSQAGATFLGNGGDAVSKGFELETALYPIEGLRLGFNAAYTDAKLTSLLPSAAVNNYLLGYQLPNVPKWSGALTADYTFPVGNDWKGDIGGGVRYVGKKFANVISGSPIPGAALPNFILDDYMITDLSAGISNDRYSIRLFARNVTNEHPFTGGGVSTDIFNAPVEVIGDIMQPRTVGVSVDVSF
jgi:outer membrane receptor protein involved in Fe transport